MNYKPWHNWLFIIIKVTIFIVACYFIYQVTQKNITALKSIEIENKFIFIINFFIAIIIYIMLMMALVFAWLVLLGFKEPQRCAQIYFKSQILKYLPGNVFHFAYRHQQTKNEHFSHKQLGKVAVYEMIALAIAALLMVNLLFLWPNEVTWLTGWLVIPYWSVLLIEIIGLLILFQLINNSGFLTIISCYLMYFFGMGLITYLLIFVLGFGSQPYLYITACFAASWLVGYVVPGAPGGTGVREMVFIMLCTPKMAEYEALVIIALIRLISILGETGMYFISSKLSQPYRHFSTWSGRTMP